MTLKNSPNFFAAEFLTNIIIMFYERIKPARLAKENKELVCIELSSSLVACYYACLRGQATRANCPNVTEDINKFVRQLYDVADLHTYNIVPNFVVMIDEKVDEAVE